MSSVEFNNVVKEAYADSIKYLDKGDGFIKLLCSTDVIDSQKDIVRVEGWTYDPEHTPGLWGHNQTALLPIMMSTNVGIGKIDKADFNVKDGSGYGLFYEGEFAPTTFAQEVRTLTNTMTSKGVRFVNKSSVGMRGGEVRRLPGGRYDFVKGHFLKEVSLCAVPALASTYVAETKADLLSKESIEREYKQWIRIHFKENYDYYFKIIKNEMRRKRSC